MSATVTATHRVTLPKKASAFLAKRAKSEKVSISHVIVALIEERAELLDELEDMRLSSICEERRAEREASGEKLIPHDEFWKLAKDIPYNPGK